MTLTVEQLRRALESLSGDLPVAISFPDFRNDGMQYETRDVRLSGIQENVAGEAQPCFMLDAWGGV